MLIVDDLLVWLPVKGLRWILEQVQRVAEHEVLDEEPIVHAILETELALEEGRIDEAEHAERQDALMAQLREVRELKKALAEQAAGEPAETGGSPGLSGGVSLDVDVDLSSWGPDEGER